MGKGTSPSGAIDSYRSLDVRIDVRMADDTVDDSIFTTIINEKDAVSNEDSHDQRDMVRLGRTQQVKRVFRMWSLLSFTCVVTSTWEYLMLGLDTGLSLGGRAGLFWSYIWSMICFAFLSASLAEMASMAPTAGGQYHWVSEFAPRKYQKPMSYVAAWLSCLSWQSGNAYGNLLTGSLIEIIIQHYRPDYEILPWRSFLLVLPGLLAVTLVTVTGHKFLPVLQNVTMIVHVVGCVLVIVTIWVTAPHIHVKDVVFSWNNASGYNSMYVVLMIGQNSAQSALASTDSAAHMAEEVHDASITVPRAIMNALWVNGTMGFLLLATVLFSLPNLEEAAADPSGFSFFGVVRAAWSETGFMYMLWILSLLIFLGNIPFAASTARLTFALARDGAIPFPDFFARINTYFGVPANAILLTMSISLIMALVNLGSTSASGAILSISAACQMGCYCISISCVFWRRLTAPETLPTARWSLGRWGKPINAVAIMYSSMIVFWVVWPQSLPVTWETFNFSAPVTATVIVICSVTYACFGRKVYTSPVELVRKL
ncbi:Choline transport protein [Sphaceloma murrayae]|uniref:Choline transport protein n=1 Tax=Sphaceloma murrayae TaxID=2082308 RepID=A0A2K1R320_9PEZI|nr:Choline transport protein [Sphaceloma murrayae]